MEAVNGLPLLATFNIPNGDSARRGRLIVVDQGSHFLRDRYVVATQYGDGVFWESHWSGGDYCFTFSEAMRVFVERIERETGISVLAEAA